MTCRHSENELALYVEGDLPPAKADQVDVHLHSCPVCRQFVDELRETQSTFKSIRQETVSPQALAHLRTRVLGQVAAQNRRPGWGRWVYALAGVAFVVVVVAGALSRYDRPVAKVQAVAVSPPAVLQPSVALHAEVVADKQPPKPHLRRSHRPPETKAAEPPKEIMVKLLTEDPNVVIYWLVDQNGGAL
ncbi:MAG TPA: zf-HC2 domain-containing protein [Terriglobia bacterium]|jgi:anti-sigma factor RsiW